MNRLRWYGLRLTETLGGAGVAALAILLGTLGYYGYVVWPLERQLTEAVAGEVVAIDAQETVADPRHQFAGFQAFFQDKSLEAQLRELHDAGAIAGVALKRVEYRMLEDRRASLRQYQIVMPVTSGYPAIRKFVSIALAKVPAMSLDHIAFQRKRIGDGTVEAELRFTLFLADPV